MELAEALNPLFHQRVQSVRTVDAEQGLVEDISARPVGSVPSPATEYKYINFTPVSQLVRLQLQEKLVM
jgi:hypothetical protein